MPRRLCFEAKRPDGLVWALQAEDGSWSLHRRVTGPGWETVYQPDLSEDEKAAGEPVAWIAFSVESAIEGES